MVESVPVDPRNIDSTDNLSEYEKRRRPSRCVGWHRDVTTVSFGGSTSQNERCHDAFQRAHISYFPRIVGIDFFFFFIIYPLSAQNYMPSKGLEIVSKHPGEPGGEKKLGNGKLP